MDNTGEPPQVPELGKVAIVSAIPGRVRLRVKDKTDTDTLDALARQLRNQTGIDDIRTNARTGSLTVRFDPDTASVSQLLAPLQLRDMAMLPAVAAPESSSAIRSEEVNTALKRLQSFIPPILGIAIVRALGIYGWKAIPAYLLVTGLTRSLVEQLDFDLSLVALPTGDSETPTEENVERNEWVEAIALSDVIAHEIPGRVRLHLPRVAEDAAYATRLEQLATAEDDITRVRINPASGSVTLNYRLHRSPQGMRSRIARLLVAAETANLQAVPSNSPPSNSDRDDTNNSQPPSAGEGEIPKSSPSGANAEREADDADDDDDAPPDGQTLPESSSSETESNGNGAIASVANPDLESTTQALSASESLELADLPEDRAPDSPWSRFKSSAMSVMLDWMANVSIRQA